MWKLRLFLLLGLCAVPAAGAQPDAVADSVAMRLYESAGGAAIWSRVPYVKFNYTHVIGPTPARTIRHLWNRRTNEYRMELPGPTNEPYVVLFDLDTRQGTAFWNGTELEDREARVHVQDAYRRFVHDSFWLLTSLKLFEPGVERTYVADSSDAETAVLHVEFSLQGYAPSEEYWLYVDRESNLIRQALYWGPHDARDQPPRGFVWADYERHWGGSGYVYLSTFKRAIGRPHAIRTDKLQFPAAVAPDMFTSGDPKLSPPAPDPN
ncbi:MAG: hypothetical protein OXM02_11520 [Bacteroidota bacterium]|nr:hypothetical protein [Bacteroidota bacterium]MDE2835129.1 hypothetical protein [Bacteroidota bacterium]MDE2956467.1 hypothetical protein [Bacteroidota bacterium]